MVINKAKIFSNMWGENNMWRDILASIHIVKVEVYRKAKVFEVVFNCVIRKGKVELSVY